MFSKSGMVWRLALGEIVMAFGQRWEMMFVHVIQTMQNVAAKVFGKLGVMLDNINTAKSFFDVSTVALKRR